MSEQGPSTPISRVKYNENVLQAYIKKISILFQKIQTIFVFSCLMSRIDIEMGVLEGTVKTRLYITLDRLKRHVADAGGK